MKTSLRIIQTTVAFLALAISGMCQNSWDSAADYSGTSNPNGAWSYGQISTVRATALNLFTVQWGSCGWYLGNAATGSPSISCGAAIWAQNNANGYPCIRWTCPTSGNYKIKGEFVADDSRGVDNFIYVVTNGSIVFSNLIQSYPQSVPFLNDAVPLNQGDFVDFTLVWAGGINMQYGWTAVDAVISPSVPSAATAIATIVNGFVVGVTLTDNGYGYTNTPLVRLIGGGGSGAEAVAVVSNGLVTAVNVLNTGSDYTNAPLVVIEPPFVPNPVLSIAPMSFLAFSNLTVGGVYQLQQWEGYYWSNQPVSFTATNALDTQIVAGPANSGDYQMALSPVPAQAFATAQVVNGFVVGIALTSGGSDYVTNPAVTIVGSGSNATAMASISGGVVTNITVTSPGIGYTNATLVEIGQPPIAAVSPTMVLPMVQLDSTSLAPYDNYQIQFTPVLGTTWKNWNGGLFSATDVTNSQLFFFTNGTGFFRMQYLP